MTSGSGYMEEGRRLYLSNRAFDTNLLRGHGTLQGIKMCHSRRIEAQVASQIHADTSIDS